MTNPERLVIEKIDRLEADWAAQDKLIDYEMQRGQGSYEKDAQCELCGGEWHGMKSTQPFGRHCPGEYASDEVKAVWREQNPNHKRAYDALLHGPQEDARSGGMDSAVFVAYVQAQLAASIQRQVDTEIATGSVSQGDSEPLGFVPAYYFNEGLATLYIQVLPDGGLLNVPVLQGINDEDLHADGWVDLGYVDEDGVQ